MTTEVFTLGGNESNTHVHEVKRLVELLQKSGSIRIAFKTTVKPKQEAGMDEAVNVSVQTLISRIRLFELDAIPRDVDYVQTHTLAVGRPIDPLWRDVDVHVTLESDVIHFTEALRHFPNGSGFPRLLEMVKRGRGFTAIYTYDDKPSERAYGRGEVQVLLVEKLRISGVTGCAIGVIRQDWPLEPGGKCRIDVRIEPQPEVAAAPSASGALPLCDVCGHQTVRSGSLFKCLNCGNEMESK
ncbi:MAG: hypothetical protein HY567_00825 [Candidatus Kerfeldbacteria bacterium]|nr:hypothetical protein [Candidatus Kerfeldbacteria bacterium]